MVLCGLTLIVLITYWNRFDDLVFDDLPSGGAFSSSVSEEHVGSAGVWGWS